MFATQNVVMNLYYQFLAFENRLADKRKCCIDLCACIPSYWLGEKVDMFS